MGVCGLHHQSVKGQIVCKKWFLYNGIKDGPDCQLPVALSTEITPWEVGELGSLGKLQVHYYCNCKEKGDLLGCGFQL